MKLAERQPRLINRSPALLLHDNARPHTAQQTILTLQELQLEAIRHPPYLPNLAPTDYYFFLNLDNFLQGKQFCSREAVELVESSSPEFYRKALNDLPTR